MSTLTPTHEDRFAELYERHVARVRRTAAAQLRRGDLDLVDDITQEVFLQLWTYLLTDVAILYPAALLTTITRHMVGMHYRRAAAHKRPTLQATDYSEPTAERLNPAHSAEDTAVARMEARDHLDHLTGYGRTHAPCRAERLLALAVAA